MISAETQAHVLTTDYNLNRVAQIQGVKVLNVNELSNAVRPVVIPGEDLRVRIVQAGKERHQGVGYLADGTMIVVENGDKFIGQEVQTEVTRVFQTVAGKMIFATPRGETKSGNRAHKHPEPTDETASPQDSIATQEPVTTKTPKVTSSQHERSSQKAVSEHGRRPRRQNAEDKLIKTLNGPNQDVS